MKSQIPLPPKISALPSDEFIRQIFQRFGKCDEEFFPWIAISLIHPTYINENQNQLEGINQRFLNTLESLAAIFSHLALLHIAHEDASLGGTAEYTRFVQVSHSAFIYALFDEFSLEKVVLIGKGEKVNLTNSIKFTLARQFCGGLLLCYGYDALKPLVYGLTQKIHPNSKIKDCKTILQEYSQAHKMGQPLYNVVQEFGPAHSKEFVIRVSTADGKSACARASSKKDASRKAAEEYINHFLPTLVDKSAEPRPINAGKTSTSLVALHKDFVLSICRLFHIGQDKAWMFGQSLTHPSFVNESTDIRLVDHRIHAQFGAKVIETLFSQQIAYLALKNSSGYNLSIEHYRSVIGLDGPSSEGFDRLNLQNGILLGSGERKVFHKSFSGKAEVFQAVIGAAFKAHGTWQKFVDNLPQILDDWLTDKLKRVRELEIVNEWDPTNGLQIILQAIRMNMQYEFSASGPDHAKNYRSNLYLRSETTSESFAIKSTKGFSSKRAAAHYVASVALKAANIVNSELGINPEMSYEDNAELMRFARFLLRHLLAANLKPADIQRWRNLGILGSKLLMDGKMYEFRLWAIAIGNIFESHFITNALKLYSSIPTMSDEDQIGYKADVMSITSFVENLSPDTNHADIRMTDNFNKIVNLSKIYKVISQKWVTITLESVS